MPFQRFCVKWMIYQLICGATVWFIFRFSDIFILNRANIFSFTSFLSQIFTSHGSLRCFLSNRNSKFHFYQKSLTTPPLSRLTCLSLEHFVKCCMYNCISITIHPYLLVLFVSACICHRYWKGDSTHRPFCFSPRRFGVNRQCSEIHEKEWGAAGANCTVSLSVLDLM